MAALLIYCTSSLLAQPESNEDYKYSARININYHKVWEETGFSIGNLSPVFTFKNRKNHIHEFELIKFDIDKTQDRTVRNGMVISGIRETSHHIALRYQYDLLVLKGLKNFRPYVGPSISLHFQWQNIEPLVTNSFTRKFFTYYNILSVVTGTRYSIGKRLFVDLSIPIEFFAYRLESTSIENPFIPRDQQGNHTHETDFPISNELKVRLGVGVKFGSPKPSE